MGICIVFVLYGGMTLGTPECQSQLFYDDGLIVPHEVVYTSHMDQCWQGYATYVPFQRVVLNSPTTLHRHYNFVTRRHISRVRYSSKVRPVYRHHRYRHARPHKKYYKHKPRRIKRKSNSVKNYKHNKRNRVKRFKNKKKHSAKSKKRN